MTKKKTIVKVLLIMLAVITIVLIANSNCRFYYKPEMFGKTDKDILKQLNFLEHELKYENLGNKMQDYYPEGFIFINSLYGLIWCDIARVSDCDSIKQRAKREAKYAYKQICSEYGRHNFIKEMQPNYGIFYMGWKNYLLGKMLLLNNPLDTNSIEYFEFRKNCRSIAEAYTKSETPFLESYPGSSWPADNIVAVASLNLFEKISHGAYKKFINEWIGKVNSRLDASSGMIPHSVNYLSGYTSEKPRGSSMALSIKFLAEIEPEFAFSQFKLFHKHFAISRLGLPCMREFPLNDNKEADIDSGPVIFDIGFVSTIVSIGVYRVMGEYETSDAISQNIEAWGFGITNNVNKYYMFGLLPIGDAFIAWSRLSNPPKEIFYKKSVNEIKIGNWRITTQILSIIILLIIFCVCFFCLRRR